MSLGVVRSDNQTDMTEEITCRMLMTHAPGTYARNLTQQDYALLYCGSEIINLEVLLC